MVGRSCGFRPSAFGFCNHTCNNWKTTMQIWENQLCNEDRSFHWTMNKALSSPKTKLTRRALHNSSLDMQTGRQNCHLSGYQNPKDQKLFGPYFFLSAHSIVHQLSRHVRKRESNSLASIWTVFLFILWIQLELQNLTSTKGGGF